MANSKKKLVPVTKKVAAKPKAKISARKAEAISRSSFEKYLTPLLDPANHIEEDIPVVLAASNKRDKRGLASVTNGLKIFASTLNTMHGDNWFKYVLEETDPQFNYHTINVSPKFRDKYQIPTEMIVNYLVCQAFSFLNLLPVRAVKGVSKDEQT